MKNCRSQSCDGTGNMAGANICCAIRIKQVYPKAEYYFFMNHYLRIAVTKSCKLPEMQVMLDTIKQVGIFYKYSPTEQRKLEECISAVSREKNQAGGEVTERRIKKVKILCDTRWVDRHLALKDIALLRS